MSKRLQVLLEESEFDDLREAARREGVPVSEWVRRVLRDARRRQPEGDIDRKMRALQKALQYEFPAPDIDQMVAEIEQGYPKDLPE
jgi:hypothetical protein